MSFRLSLLLLNSSLLPLMGQEEVIPNAPTKEQKAEEEDSRFRIPLGAVISNVTLPYFGKNHRQISLLTAKEMRVEGADPDLNPEIDSTEVELMKGKDMKLWLFDKKGLIRSTTTIPEATYHVNDEELVTTGDFMMRGADDQFSARSNGAIITLQTGQALLLGPGITRFTLPKRNETSMNLHPLLPLTAAMQMLVALPPEIDPDHLEKFEELVAPRIIPPENADEQFAEADLNNAALAKRVAEYLLKVGKTELLTQIADPPVVRKDPFDELPEAGPNDVSIEFDKGAYFDSEALEVAYFGNIAVEGLGLKMTCNKELKAIFHPPSPKQKTDKKEDAEKDDSPIKNFDGFGDLKQVTANGKIRLEGVNKDGKKFFLRGDRALFQSNPKNPKKEGQITIRGDDLAFILGDPEDKKATEPLIRGDSTTKDAWIIVDVKQGLDPTKTDLTIQFSKGNFNMGTVERK